jgi:hypothetical protein
VIHSVPTRIRKDLGNGLRVIFAVSINLQNNH